MENEDLFIEKGYYGMYGRQWLRLYLSCELSDNENMQKRVRTAKKGSTETCFEVS